MEKILEIAFPLELVVKFLDKAALTFRDEPRQRRVAGVLNPH